MQPARPIDVMNRVMDDSTLLATLADDLDLAFEALVRSRQDRVFSIALRILGDPTEAEDVAQDAFVRAYRALGGWPAARIRELRLDAWLATIVVNTARSRIRRRARTAARESLTFVDELDHPRSTAGRDARRAGWPGPKRPRHGRSGCSALPERYRAPIVLRHVDGLGYDEIAEALGRPEGTVKAQVHRGLGQLRAMLEAEDRTDETAPPTRLPPAARAARTTSRPPATLRRTPLPAPSSRRSPDDRIDHSAQRRGPGRPACRSPDVRAPTRSCPGRSIEVGLADAYAAIDSPIGPLFVAFNGLGVSTVEQAPDAPTFERRHVGRVGRAAYRVAALPDRLGAAIDRRLGRRSSSRGSRSTSAAGRRSSATSGPRPSRSRVARSGRTAGSPPRSAVRGPCARSAPRSGTTRCRSSSRATGWSGATG